MVKWKDTIFILHLVMDGVSTTTRFQFNKHLLLFLDWYRILQSDDVLHIF